MSSIGYHEPVDEIPDANGDMHRAIVSLMDKLEAVAWYNKRRAPSDDEKERAAMLIEWTRRRDPKFSTQLKTYLFTDKPIAHE